MIFLVLINASVFITLSFVHVYWAMINNEDMRGVLPTDTNGKEVFQPGVIGTFAIAAFLGICAFITIGNLGIYESFINHSIITCGTILIGFLFIVRAIGDFKYAGFFKRIKGTCFSANDTRYYSPLCLFVGVCNIIIAFI